MTVRTTIMLLTVPLFLLLAAVNAALLYFQEETEISQALHDQAEAAAVTSAEFITRIDRPFAILAEPRRAREIGAAARKLAGMDALYLVGAGSQSLALFTPMRPLDPSVYQRPARVEVRPVSGAPGDRHVIALAPAAPGAFVVARIDAEPLMKKVSAIRRLGWLIVLVAGLIATGLAWFVARRITGELQVSAAVIVAADTDGRGALAGPLTIREAKDLADAIRLMKSNNNAAAKRDLLIMAQNDRARTTTSALLAWRDAEFAPIARAAAGRAVALRLLGKADLGSFFALCEHRDEALIVIGRCGGPTLGDALANALAARRFLMANMFAIPVDECLTLARMAYGIEELRSATWNANWIAPVADPLLVQTDHKSAHSAAVYAERNPGASPEELLDGIAVLIAPSGVFAALTAD